MDRLKELKQEIPVVPLGDSDYLLAVFFEAGPVSETPMGEVPLNWDNLLAYSFAVAADLEPWEYRVLIAMSKAYLEEWRGGENPLRISPLVRGDLHDD